MGVHNTTDNPALCEGPKQREDASRRDPIDRVVRYLTQRGLWDEERDKQTRASVRAEVDAALEKAAAFPGVTPNQLFDHIYSELPERLRRQRDELMSAGTQARPRA